MFVWYSPTAINFGGCSNNAFPADWLVSYQPQPGTVFYVGYGARMTEPEPLRFQHLARRDDAFFVQASHLFRRQEP